MKILVNVIVRVVFTMTKKTHYVSLAIFHGFTFFEKLIKMIQFIVKHAATQDFKVA